MAKFGTQSSLDHFSAKLRAKKKNDQTISDTSIDEHAYCTEENIA